MASRINSLTSEYGRLTEILPEELQTLEVTLLENLREELLKILAEDRQFLAELSRQKNRRIYLEEFEKSTEYVINRAFPLDKQFDQVRKNILPFLVAHYVICNALLRKLPDYMIQEYRNCIEQYKKYLDSSIENRDKRIGFIFLHAHTKHS